MPHARRARVHHEKRGRVIVRVREARVDKRHLVHLLRELRKQAASPRTRLPVLLKLERRFHQSTDSVGKKSRLRIKARHRLAVALFKLRLVVPRVHLTRSSIHKQPDYRFCLRGIMPRSRSERIEPRRGESRAGEHGLNSHPAEAGSGALKHLASCDHRSVEVGKFVRGNQRLAEVRHRLLLPRRKSIANERIGSSQFRRTRLTA